MSVNLATKFSTKLDDLFTRSSVTDAYTSNDYDFDGVNTIKVWNLLTDELNDYDSDGTGNRYGTATEVEDQVTSYTLSKMKSIAKTFDSTNIQDQMFVKKATAYLKQLWQERYVPAIDKHRIATWANGAGLGKLSAVALTKSTVMNAILDAHAAMDDAEVPQEGRVTLVPSTLAVSLKLATELGNNQNWTDKTIIKGKIAEINGSPVVSVPSGRLPAGFVFMIKYKRSSVDPVKLKKLVAYDDDPNVCGISMRGLVRFDSFVLANKANGIYIYYNAGSATVSSVEENNSDNKMKFTVSASSTGTLYFTTDGSNPKTSSTRISVSISGASTGIYATAFADGSYHVRAYFQSSASGAIASPISEFDITFA